VQRSRGRKPQHPQQGIGKVAQRSAETSQSWDAGIRVSTAQSPDDCATVSRVRPRKPRVRRRESAHDPPQADVRSSTRTRSLQPRFNDPARITMTAPTERPPPQRHADHSARSTVQLVRMPGPQRRRTRIPTRPGSEHARRGPIVAEDTRRNHPEQLEGHARNRIPPRRRSGFVRIVQIGPSGTARP